MTRFAVVFTSTDRDELWRLCMDPKGCRAQFAEEAAAHGYALVPGSTIDATWHEPATVDGAALGSEYAVRLEAAVVPVQS